MADSNGFGSFTRRDAMLAIGGLGAGTVAFGAGAAAARLYGGDADNTTGDEYDGPIDGNFGSGNVGNNGQDPSSPSSDNSDTKSNNEPQPENNADSSGQDDTESSGKDPDFTGSEDSNSGGSSSSLSDLDVDASYNLNDEVEINLDNLDPVYEDSAIVLGVQENGNLLAWNTEVENEEGHNPFWRFPSDQFPNRDFFSIDGEHPLEEVYSELDQNIENLSEGAVMTFYSSEDEGSWKDHREYKEVSFEELKNGLIEYSSAGHAQDYFLNRSTTLEREEATLEDEWQQLLKDAL